MRVGQDETSGNAPLKRQDNILLQVKAFEDRLMRFELSFSTNVKLARDDISKFKERLLNEIKCRDSHFTKIHKQLESYYSPPNFGHSFLKQNSLDSFRNCEKFIHSKIALIREDLMKNQESSDDTDFDKDTVTGHLKILKSELAQLADSRRKKGNDYTFDLLSQNTSKLQERIRDGFEAVERSRTRIKSTLNEYSKVVANDFYEEVTTRKKTEDLMLTLLEETCDRVERSVTTGNFKTTKDTQTTTSSNHESPLSYSSSNLNSAEDTKQIAANLQNSVGDFNYFLRHRSVHQSKLPVQDLLLSGSNRMTYSDTSYSPSRYSNRPTPDEYARNESCNSVDISKINGRNNGIKAVDPFSSYIISRPQINPKPKINPFTLGSMNRSSAQAVNQTDELKYIQRSQLSHSRTRSRESSNSDALFSKIDCQRSVLSNNVEDDLRPNKTSFTFNSNEQQTVNSQGIRGTRKY